MNQYIVTLKFNKEVFTFNRKKPFLQTKLRDGVICKRDDLATDTLFTYAASGDAFSDVDCKEIESVYFDIIQSLDMENMTITKFSDFLSFMDATLKKVFMARNIENLLILTNPLPWTQEEDFATFKFDMVTDESYKRKEVGEFSFLPEVLAERENRYQISAIMDKGKVFKGTLTIRNMPTSINSISTEQPVVLDVQYGLQLLKVTLTERMQLLFALEQGSYAASQSEKVVQEVKFVKELEKAIREFVLMRKEIPICYKTAISPATVTVTAPVSGAPQGKAGGYVQVGEDGKSYMIYPDGTKEEVPVIHIDTNKGSVDFWNKD